MLWVTTPQTSHPASDIREGRIFRGENPRSIRLLQTLDRQLSVQDRDDDVIALRRDAAVHHQQIAVEADELKQMPEEEKEEMVLIYQAKGLDETLARALADRLMANKEIALDTLVREELGIDPDELGGSAWTAAASSFFLFAVGAIVPVTPFFWLGGTTVLVASLAASGVALLLIGAGTSLFTGRSAYFSALRQLLIGLAAAGVTFGIGRLLGISLGG